MSIRPGKKATATLSLENVKIQIYFLQSKRSTFLVPMVCNPVVFRFFFPPFLRFYHSSVLYSFVLNRPSNPSKDLPENTNSSLIFKAPIDRATPLQGKHINNYNFLSHSHICPTAKNLAPQGLLKISKIVSQSWFGTAQSNKKWLTDSGLIIEQAREVVYLSF